MLHNWGLVMSGIGDEVERLVAPLVKPGSTECRPCQERKRKLNELKPGQFSDDLVREYAAQMAAETEALKVYLASMPAFARQKTAELILKKAIARARKA